MTRLRQANTLTSQHERCWHVHQLFACVYLPPPLLAVLLITVPTHTPACNHTVKQRNVRREADGRNGLVINSVSTLSMNEPQPCLSQRKECFAHNGTRIQRAQTLLAFLFCVVSLPFFSISISLFNYIHKSPNPLQPPQKRKI